MTQETIEISLVMTEPAFTSLTEAIAFSEHTDRMRRNDSIDACVGRMIRRADWSPDAIFLHLDNGTVMRFAYVRSTVDLTVDDEGPPDVGGGSWAHEVTIIVPSGQQWLWNRRDLVQALEGKDIYRICAGQSGYWLYVKGLKILWIHFLVERATGRPFLYWDLTD